MDFISDLKPELKPYLDEQGRLTAWPSKRNKGRVRQLALSYLASKFECGFLYSERDVNALLREYHTFEDPALLRRELFDRGLLDRVPNGSAYWLR
jgi:hypothetical protein